MDRTRRFNATDDSGRVYQILETTQSTDVTSLDSNKEELETGYKEYSTAGGKHVNWISKGHYEIVGLPNIPLVSDDPDAP